MWGVCPQRFPSSPHSAAAARASLAGCKAALCPLVLLWRLMLGLPRGSLFGSSSSAYFDKRLCPLLTIPPYLLDKPQSCQTVSPLCGAYFCLGSRLVQRKVKGALKKQEEGALRFQGTYCVCVLLG